MAVPKIFAISSVVLGCLAAPETELVREMPLFGKLPFKVYSGYVTVPGPVAGYDSLEIHYQLHMSQTNPSNDPLVTWHQGGPGGSAMYGLYTEMGYMQLDDQGAHVNEYAWNKVANMLYLESPAGSSVAIGGPPVGFSSCYKDGKMEETCHWNDVSQAEAYTKTLLAFLEKFPELRGNDLYLTGESYAGQYLPNIANYILTNKVDLNLKGMALGNSCWGGTETSVMCNGPKEDKMDVDLYHGKGLISTAQRDLAYEICGFNGSYGSGVGESCNGILYEISETVGPHDPYNLYDNCPGASEMMQTENVTMREILKRVRNSLPSPIYTSKLKSTPSGGYLWSCGGGNSAAEYFLRGDVRKALHLNKTLGSRFTYTWSGPASITLYPYLARHIRMLIYSGDADSVVPYLGTEEWTSRMAENGVVKVNKAWHPWYIDSSSEYPAGSATLATSVAGHSFTFLTIRLAGHMVPTFRPKASLTFFERFLNGDY
ncbi:hypothetical protein AAMO2058_000010300 [Amorphochlora amoebiformis]